MIEYGVEDKDECGHVSRTAPSNKCFTKKASINRRTTEPSLPDSQANYQIFLSMLTRYRVPNIKRSSTKT